MPFDTGLMALLKAHTGPMARKVAVVFTNIGAFDGICIYPTLIMLLWGWARKLPRWRRHALLYMTTILLVGLAANILRGGLGRARPGNPDGWYGPTIKSKYNSFPSAHASVAGASFAYVLVACPPASVPVGAIALGICWSRVQLERHRPSDIVFGAGLGFTIAFVFNRALRRTFSLGGPPTESTTVAGPPHPPS
ncbi:MAG: phosphatase PAP2 family protein [Verrucomicrobiota bacterium]|nr:phosphatase PAP2 family protein [Verrucomicrobiota bacterium]